MSDAEAHDANSRTPKRPRLQTASFVLAGLVLLVLVVRISHTSTAQGSSTSMVNGPPFAYGYTCCSASVVDTIYHPGQTITVHWTRTRYSLDGNQAAPTTLSMALNGPFRSVTSLKKDSIGPHPHPGHTTADSLTIRLMDNVAASPVSRIQIPNDASSGFYNMTQKTGTKNLWVSGASVIRIESSAK